MDHDGCRAYCQFLESLSPHSLDALDRLAAPTVRFRDPFHDVRGLSAVKRVFAKVFDDVDEVRITVTHRAAAADMCFLRWHLTCRPRRMDRGQPWVVEGVTELHFDADGKVVEHVDYWDAGRAVYERVPVLGRLVRRLRQRLGRV